MTDGQKLKQYMFPFILLMVMLLDGQLNSLFSGVFFDGHSIMMSHLFLLCLMLTSFVSSRTYIIIVALILGFLFDGYYIGVIGIYTLLFPVVAGLSHSIARYFYVNTFIAALIYFILVTVLNITVYIVQGIFGLTTVPMMTFIVNMLTPTLLLNMVYFVLFYFQLRKLFYNGEGPNNRLYFSKK